MTTEEVDIGINRPANITIENVEQVLMEIGEVDIGIRPAAIPPIIHAYVVDYQVSHFLLVLLTKTFIVTREVDIGPRSATCPPITQVGMVDCSVSLLLHVLSTKVFMVMKGVI